LDKDSLSMPRILDLTFDLPDPHCVQLRVGQDGIDAYNHVNNAVYVTWCDRAAWSHSAALGLPIEKCLQMDRGMAVIRTVIAYLRPALLGDELIAATWLLPSESRLCVRRRFQIVRVADAETLARAEVEYACIELSTGKPARWPKEFRDGYVALSHVVQAAASLSSV
jgi:acyl-CoA thioester hydrolase